MGAYQYCNKCDGPMSKPTLRECVEDSQDCPSCGHAHYTTRGELADALETMEQTVARLDAVLALLVPKPPE